MYWYHACGCQPKWALLADLDIGITIKYLFIRNMPSVTDGHRIGWLCVGGNII